MSFVSLTPNEGLTITSFTVDKKAGLIRFAYASVAPVEPGAVATVVFTVPTGPAAVVATTLECNDDVAVNEETVIRLGDGFMITIEDYTKLDPTHIVGIVDKGLVTPDSEGKVTFTVTSTVTAEDPDQPIMVAVKKTGEEDESYQRVECETDDEGVHSFTITVEADTTVALVFKGDVDLNGAVTGNDGTKIKRYAVGYTDTITEALKLLVADVNGDGEITGFDGTKASRYAVGYTTALKW